MDESWRVSIGSIVPRRRLSKAPPATALDADDFRDVFGGPPRSVLLRRFSADLSSSATAAGHAEHRPLFSCDEAFRLQGGGGGEWAGRNLSWLRIPSKGTPARARFVRTEVGFYDDIFGSNAGRIGGDRRSKSKSKSSSSILTSEDVSPPLGASSLAAEDAVLSSSSSKLRPITIPSGERHNTWQAPSINSFPSDPYNFQYSKDCKSNSQSSSDTFRQKSHIGFSCCFSAPETVSLEASFRRSSKDPPICYNSDADSSSSVISSAFMDPLSFQAERQTKMLPMEMEEGNRVSETPFSIEMGRPGLDEIEDAAAIDEAIAWAKQKI